MTTKIGIIKTVIGQVTATSTDGSQRKLVLGDHLFANEIITTDIIGAVEIELSDGRIMYLGRASQVLLDGDIFKSSQDTAEAVTEDELTSAQAAILAGADPSLVTNATAADTEILPDGNEGVDIVRVIHDEPSQFTTRISEDPETNRALSDIGSRSVNVESNPRFSEAVSSIVAINFIGSDDTDNLPIIGAMPPALSITTINGGDDDDTLYGGNGKDELYGGDGDDTLYGDNGKDELYGGDGDDTLYGGNGKDKLSGGSGDDILTGGDGDDLFIWERSDLGSVASPARDQITDFNHTNNANGGDVLDLSDLLMGSLNKIEGLAVNDGVGSGQHLRVLIKDENDAEVQTIDLNNIAVNASASDTAMVVLKNLLDNGGIVDVS